MSFHEPHRHRFLQRSPDPQILSLLETVAPYGVRHEAATAGAGQVYWRAIGVHHLSPDENRGKHVIFVDIVDESGQRVRDPNLKLVWGWEGQRADEHAAPKAFDKGDNEPAGNVDLYPGQHTWVRVEGDGLPSDRILNLHSSHPDEPAPGGEKWTTYGHHSFYVLFQRTRKTATAGPGDGGTTTPIHPPPSPPPQEELAIIAFGPFSHQDLINAFAGAAASLGLSDNWALLTRSGMRVEDLAADRTAPYQGTALHLLPNLTVSEKNLLMRQLAHVLTTRPVPPRTEPAPPVTPQPQPPPTPARLGNRLGYYLHSSQDQHGLWDAITRGRPPAILIHADTANTMLLEEIRRFRAPDAFVIGRMYKDVHTQRQMLESGDAAGQGRAFAEEILNYNFGLATRRGQNGRLLIDAWMSLNEAVPGPASRQFAEEPVQTGRLLRNYDQFQVAFRQRLQEAGVEAVAFNFGAGNFNAPEHYLEFFPGTLASYIYLGFHEYGWPTLYPDPGSATSAGLYRRCLAGIRAHYGERHRVIITEAGLTRMYQNPQWGDVGWLNHDVPLQEESYWRSLAWYNDHLNQDGYVIGACLFEVGHYGGWESFRHLGTDNQGQPIHLMDRLAALNDSAQPSPAAAPAPTPVSIRRPITIGGAVIHQGKPVAGATVRLFGGQETLGMARRAAVATSSITWTRQVSGLSGTLRQVWSKQVAGKVAGLTWEEFKTLSGVYNPTLATAGGRGQPTFKRTHTYFLPENHKEATEIVWDRPLTGFGGTLWACWQQNVENKVVGMTYAAFKKSVGHYNPALAEDDNRFLAEKRYNLPRNAGQHEYALYTVTGKRGRFRFAGLPPGVFRLEVTAEGALPEVLDFSAEASMDLEVALQQVIAPPISPPSPRPGAAQDAMTPRPEAAQQAAGLDFVRTHGTEFVTSGMPLRFIGVNIRGLVHYGDGRILPHSTDGHRHEQVRTARDMGARVIRVFLPSEHTNPQETAERLRSLVALVQQEAPNLYILPALCNLYRDVPFRIQGDDGFYQRLDPNFHAELLNADFFSGGYRRNYLPFVQHIVQAFRDEAQIFAWEIGNELKLNPATGSPAGDPNVAAFIQFMLAVAQEIRRLDPNHLITTGMISTHHAWLHNDELRHQLYRSPLFDFLTIHCYNDEYHNDDSALANALHKPFIIEEAGYSNSFGPDRSGKTAEDMRRWFGLGARGYLPWGFMATGNDMGDGDSDSGMDRALHRDWDALFNLYRNRANELAQVDPNWRPVSPPPPPTPPPSGNFAQGTQVHTHDWVNVRKSPGHQNKPGDDVLGALAPGATATITGAAVNADGLTWWPVHGTLPDGRTVDGWAAESVGGNRLLGAAPPPPQTPQADAGRPLGPRGTSTRAQRAPRRTPAGGLPSPAAQAAARGEFSPGQQAFATAYVNLRQDPGYLNKPGDHVIGSIPLGAPVAILDGPVHADGLTWWAVRGPLLDNRVATGWAAAVDPNGQRLLGTTPPPPQPQPAPTGVHGQPFQVNDTVVVMAQAANVRQSPGHANRPPEHVVGAAARGAAFTITGGPQMADELEWWPVSGVGDGGQPLAGWMALTAPDGRRLLATKATAGAIRITRPFAVHVPLTQGWGAWPEYYRDIKYDNVPLKGHNGLDFGTRIGAPVLAVDAGVVIKVDFEVDGFGNHIIIRHAWGESLYAHLESVAVGKDTQVGVGQQVGLAGKTGKCFGEHLHFGIRIFPYRRTDGWGGFVDPTPFMSPGDLITSRASTPALMAPELPGRARP